MSWEKGSMHQFPYCYWKPYARLNEPLACSTTVKFSRSCLHVCDLKDPNRKGERE